MHCALSHILMPALHVNNSAIRMAISRAAAARACRCAVLGVPGELAPDFTDALLGYGAVAAWIHEAIPPGGEEQPIYIDPEPGVGQGKLWIKAVWHDCKVVALFDEQLSRVRASHCVKGPLLFQSCATMKPPQQPTFKISSNCLSAQRVEAVAYTYMRQPCTNTRTLPCAARDGCSGGGEPHNSRRDRPPGAELE